MLKSREFESHYKNIYNQNHESNYYIINEYE